jgi:trans-aconitate 2-methyltransferase
MASPSWNPSQYLKFVAERARPFDDLLARVPTADPVRVVDLGCGPGNVTRTLIDRWPSAHVLGIDSSAAMVEAARPLANDRLEFRQADITTWTPDGPLDLIVANAALHWVPDHTALMPAWVAALRPGGTFAFQVPDNADGRAAAVFRTVAGSPRWSGTFAGGTPRDEHISRVRPLAAYADVLSRLGCAVDAWETTYLHILPGADPVLEWYAGTGLRPYLDMLDELDLPIFRADVAAALRVAYPPEPYGTVLPFHRVFVVATRL